jgi:hypothetical protein
MKSTIEYLDRVMMAMMINFLNEERLEKKYPIKFKRNKNGIKFTGFDNLKTLK